MVCHADRVASVESVLLSWPLRGLENHQESFLFQETWGEGERWKHSDSDFQSSLTFTSCPECVCSAPDTLPIPLFMFNYDNISPYIMHIHKCIHIFAFLLVVGFLVALLKISELRVVSKLSGHVLSDGFMFQQVCFRYSLNKYHNSSIEVKLLRLPARVPFLHAGCCF